MADFSCLLSVTPVQMPHVRHECPTWAAAAEFERWILLGAGEKVHPVSMSEKENFLFRAEGRM